MRVPGIPYVQGRNDYTDGDGRKYGIAIHNTSNDASDEGEASYATWRPDGVSSHFYVDHDSVTQSIDTYDRAGHAGSTHGNDHGISVEITGGNGKSRAWWLANVAWDELGRVLAIVIRHHWPDGRFEVRRASVAEMKANPKVRAFYGHNDMRLAWGGTTHTDPGPNFPWDRLFEAVNKHLTEEDDMPSLDEVRDVVRTETKRACEDAIAGLLIEMVARDTKRGRHTADRLRAVVTYPVTNLIKAQQPLLEAAAQGQGMSADQVAEVAAAVAAAVPEEIAEDVADEIADRMSGNSG